MNDNPYDDPYKVAEVILSYWLDCYSDNGQIYEVAQKRLDEAKSQAPAEVWDRALIIAHHRWGQQ